MSKKEFTEYKTTSLPRFHNTRVLILNGAFVADVVSLFAKAGFMTAKGISDANLVVFTGGSDISPFLYGEEPTQCHGFNKNRDDFEVEVYKAALKKGIPMFGICRGFQFLAAMNGGKLWQHVNNHTGSHKIYDHSKNVWVKSSSIHHQMIKEHEGFSVVATAERTATRFQSETDDKWAAINVDSPLEIEAGFWTETKCIGVQGHPELYTSYPFYAAWALDFLYEFMHDNAKGFGTISPPAFIEAGV